MTTKEMRKNQGKLAAEIKENNKLYGEYQRSTDKQNWKTPLKFWWNRVMLPKEFRNRHIGYSLARGRTYEEIEKPREGNAPDAKLVEAYRKEYEQAREEGRKAYEARKNENVCACA